MLIYYTIRINFIGKPQYIVDLSNLQTQIYQTIKLAEKTGFFTI